MESESEPLSAAALAEHRRRVWALWEERERRVAAFWDEHPTAQAQRSDYLVEQYALAVAAGEEERAEILLGVAMSDEVSPGVDALNRLLLAPGHRGHQELVRCLQDAADPSSVPFLRRAIDEGLQAMVDYNCSGFGPVAKWFSHAFASIGTPDAVAALQHYARSHPESEVREEMTYRIRKAFGEEHL